VRVPLGPGGVLAVRVRRSGGESFCIVRRLPGGMWTGTCEDFTYRQRECKHIRRVRDRLAEMAEDATPGGGLL
jgi:hypothetical protein